MNEDQIFNSLLSYYRSRGIDTSLLLENEIFKKLPLEAQIRLVQQYAKDISQGIPTGLTNDEKSGLRNQGLLGSLMGAVAGGSAGGLAAVALGKPMLSKALIPAVVFGAISGGAGGALTSSINSRADLQKRKALNVALNDVHKNPVLANVLGALSASQIYAHKDKYDADLRSKLKNIVGEVSSNATKNTATNTINHYYAKME